MRIGGADVMHDKYVDTVNPYTGRAWARVPDGDASHVDAAVKAARDAFETGPWSMITATQRGHLLRKLGDIVARDAEAFARMETADNGKLYREMLGQWRYLPEYFYYFAGMADKLAGSVLASDRQNFHLFTRQEPVGVVGAITAWNSPGMLLIMKLAAGLAAGCTFVVKPSEYTPISTIELAKRADEAGFPPGVFNVVTGGGVVGAALVNHPGIDKIAFTGGTETGKRIAASAAANLTRVSLELGGKSPNIVFEDADLDVAVNGAIAGIFGASGQSCSAGSRLLLQESIHDSFLEKLIQQTRTIRLGDPMDAETQMGPIANEPQYRKVLSSIEMAKQEGARLVEGGEAVTDIGSYFVKPTIFADVTNDMRIAQEEVFGPILSVIRFKTEEEAIAIANDTRFGLAAAVWTKNVHRAHRVSAKLRAGTVWINAYRVVSYMAPFGGFGESGLGRENGPDAMREFTETKTVFVELSGQPRDPFKLG
ncbi:MULTISPECIES: aldehyde dehydrogenase [unclassified Mesorhizobium]|uniref:aldehyde dehydrogenase n=1 Tax=unclassified Mesorhizobium TaxID=325217 RepID=UPI0024170DBD|nr:MULTISPECIES: aldehyde dehydrogenase [unclassified Mesorhizobium]WFP66042.1 aldehyde dehydrogenase [Mesorhizobium sp. WSM4904]WFP79321.1 aldehyde dehydrogenase [Mesorhizobium sp. WSM4906]